MDIIREKIQKFLKDYSLDNPEFVYLVGFSGGYDSLCLLHALKSVCPNKIIAIHLNHNWRGDASNSDEQNCAQFCQKHKIDYYSEKLPDDIPHTETAARKARYDFFERCAKKFNAGAIFTAHNKNDQAETLIFRICHGTGIVGLQGIAPMRGIYYRPLLETARADIEKYCDDLNLIPNHDNSNNDTIHKRNLIRHEILPKMAEINPNIIDTLSSLSQIARDENEVIKNFVKYDNPINTADFMKNSPSVQKRIIYEIITPFVPEDYDRKRILIVWEFVCKNASSKSGKKISITGDRWLFVNNKKIEVISNTTTAPISININSTGDFTLGDKILSISECDKFNKKENIPNFEVIYADLSKFDFNFELRNRRNGDIIQPLGMNGTQKLKKYLNEKKIPNHEKDNLLFLAQGNEILWAIGFGISDKIKVCAHPTHKIVIRKVNNEN